MPTTTKAKSPDEAPEQPEPQKPDEPEQLPTDPEEAREAFLAGDIGWRLYCQIANAEQ